MLLDACRGARLSERPIFGAVAPALLKSGVGSVIAFSHSVHVAAAQLVSERLYQALVADRCHGRARELLRLERLLLRHPGVLLHAGGGMGKTALACEAAHWWRCTGRFHQALFHSFETADGPDAGETPALQGAAAGGELLQALD